MRLLQLNRTVIRHLLMRNYGAYRQVLKAVVARGDIWTVSQGEYMAWWQGRGRATLRIIVSDGVCTAGTSLKDAVLEKFPGQFLGSGAVRCENADFSGEVWLTVDSSLEKKDLLVEILRSEGILNFRIAQAGDFFLSCQEVTPLLSGIDPRRHRRDWPFKVDVSAIRQLIVDKLAKRGLPLLRIWYHPVVDGTVIKAVFSPRYDVDRAITNLAHIRALEREYGVTSTLYLRAFCPFYSDADIRALRTADWCSEIGLHGEFVRHSPSYGDESSAARAEKSRLEELVGRPVLGVCMHGGELTSNVSANTLDAVERAGFLYDTTPGMDYYLPFLPIVNDRMGNVYVLNHVLSDIKVPPGWNYARGFYEKVMGKMDQVYHQNGVFVLMLHPEYFGFISYLFRPGNFARLIRFLWGGWGSGSEV